MDKLKFLIKDIKSGGLAVNVDIALHELQPEDVENMPVEKVILSGYFDEMGNDFLFRGNLSGIFTQNCDRCLEKLDIPFDVEIVWTFEDGPPLSDDYQVEDLEAAALEEEGAVYRFQGIQIDISPYIWEEVVLALPSKFVCDFSDKTTCPQYNEALDASSGDITADDSPRSQFAALKDLLPELEKQNLEE